MKFKPQIVLTTVLTFLTFSAYADATPPSITFPSNVPDITGSYQCQGYDPYGKSNFNSTVSVAKNNDTYTFQWLSNGYPYNLGTGTLSKDVNNIVSVVFWDPKKPDYFGTEVYEIKPNGTLDAYWVLQGQNKIGTETCNKISK